mmetsp:Transcript_49494/g.91046  ORF Transcript_49494/g.91046 Transcript_49494/m.91046 type:complete len:711 (+) Transcript_49494:109-2241(+)
MGGSPASRSGGRRRKHHRSRSRHHRRRRREHGGQEVKEEPGGEADRSSEAAPPHTWHRGPPPAGWHGSAPPVGWHGNTGPPPQVSPVAPGMPPHGALPPRLPPHYGTPVGPPPDGYGAAPPRPDVRFEAARHNPYASPFAAVPPPPNMDDDHRRWGKGKGLPYGHHLAPGEREIVDVQRGPQPDSLMVSSVPTELNTLDVLNRHFRQFGEVLKITIQVAEARAFVQFAERTSAEAAAAAEVLGRPDIVLSWAQRGKGKGKGGKGKAEKSERPIQHGPIENRVLVSDPEEQRRLDESKRKRDEIHTRKSTLLANFTEQMKAIMVKLSDSSLPEAKREAYRSLLLQIKGKMDALNAPPGFDEAMPSGAGVAPSAKRDAGGGKGEKGGRFTLDLRSKVLRVNVQQGWTLERLKDELLKFGASDEKVSIVNWDVTDVGEPSNQQALVQFKDRWSAEQFFNQRSEFPSYLEWSDRTPTPVRIVSATSSPMLKEQPDDADETPAAEQLGSEGVAEVADTEAATAETTGGETAAPEVAAGEVAAGEVAAGEVVGGEAGAAEGAVVEMAAGEAVAPEAAAAEAVAVGEGAAAASADAAAAAPTGAGEAPVSVAAAAADMAVDEAAAKEEVAEEVPKVAMTDAVPETDTPVVQEAASAAAAVPETAGTDVVAEAAPGPAAEAAAEPAGPAAPEVAPEATEGTQAPAGLSRVDLSEEEDA